MVSWGDESAIGRTSKRPANELKCVECGITPVASARGWRGVRVDLPDEDDEPALAFYCPDCAEREFG